MVGKGAQATEMRDIERTRELGGSFTRSGPRLESVSRAPAYRYDQGMGYKCCIPTSKLMNICL